MKKNVRSTNIFAGRKVLAAVSLITMMLLIVTCMQPVYAADADGASAATVTVGIKAGEHGSVNEKTGEFTETVAQGENMKLMIGCEEGYVIGRVLLNDEPLSASDLKELLGATSGYLDLEDLEDDLSVEIIFMTTSEFEIQKEYGQVAEDLSDNDTGSDNNQQSSGEGGDDSGTQTGTEGTDTGIEDTDASGDNNATGETESDPSGADTADSEDQSSENVDGTDSDSTAAADPSENLDSLIDSTEALDGDETDDETNWGTIEDSEETETDTDNDVLAETGTSTDTTGDDKSDNTTATETVKAEDTAASDKTDTADSEKGDTDSTDDGKGDYYGTPKTGDESDPYVWLVLIISGLGLAAVSAGRIVRGKLREDDGRWSA